MRKKEKESQRRLSVQKHFHLGRVLMKLRIISCFVWCVSQIQVPFFPPAHQSGSVNMRLDTGCAHSQAHAKWRQGSRLLAFCSRWITVSSRGWGEGREGARWGLLRFIILWQLARICSRLFDCGLFKNGRDKRATDAASRPPGRRWLQAQEIAGAPIVSTVRREGPDRLQWTDPAAITPVNQARGLINTGDSWGN